jgi:hypothetical protein
MTNGTAPAKFTRFWFNIDLGINPVEGLCRTKGVARKNQDATSASESTEGSSIVIIAKKAVP